MNEFEASQLVKENKEPCAAALNFYLDYLYSLKEEFFDEDFNRKPFLEENKMIEELIVSLYKNAGTYEDIRKKITEEDFNLSRAELDYIGLALFFWHRVCEAQIKKLKTAQDIAIELSNTLLKNSTVDKSQLLDFSTTL